MSRSRIPTDDTIFAVMQTQLELARKNVFLFRLLLKQWQRILKRLAYFYAQLASLPRRNRRALQRALATSLIGAAMLLALSSAPIVHAGTITVDGDGTLGTCSLADAITTANIGSDTGNCTGGSAAGDMIDLQVDVTLSALLPNITSDIVLFGNNHFVSGADTFRVFHVTSTGDFTINDTTVRNGYTSGDGAGVMNYGTLYVNDSTLSGNSAASEGGAIANEGGDVHIFTSLITGNDAGDGGGVNSYTGNFTITESTVSNNQATAEDGGGVRNFDGYLRIFRSTITGNTAVDDGGGIAQFGSVEMIVVNTTIYNNHAGDSAGNDGGGFRSAFEGIATFQNVTVVGNTAGGSGGGVAVNEGSLTLERTLISGNSASGGGNEVFRNPPYVVNADDFNVFGHSGENDAQAFLNFAPGAPSDINATSDGGVFATPLAAILNTTLADNGGVAIPGGIVQTLALVSGSPAIDRAPNTDCVAVFVSSLDERNLARNVLITGVNGPDQLCDVGAYELQAPTAVNVTGVRGSINKNGDAVIHWRTTTESQIAGFNVYRKKNGQWTMHNAQLIQAKHAGDALGDKYRFADKTVRAGKTYRYKIQIVYLDGHTEWTKIVRVQAP